MSVQYGDLFAEEQLLGLALNRPTRLPEVVSVLTPSDFYNPLHGRVFEVLTAMYATGEKVEANTVRAHLMAGGLDFDPSEQILSWMVSWNGGGSGPLIDAIQTASIRRQLRRSLDLAVSTLEDPSASLSEQMSAVSEAAKINPAVGEITGRFGFGEFEDLPDDLDPWIIPGLLRRGWRGLMVAGEGQGKSSLLRQVALCAAQGIHPFFQSIITDPISTLIVDLENPREAIVGISRRVHRLCRDVSRDYDRDRAHLWLRPQGLDLRSRVSFAEFDRVLSDTKPGLVVLGPLYKAYSRGARESDEQAANELQLILDELRSRHNFALLVEHHAPQGDGGGRQMRPYGSSYWLRWPEFGFGLQSNKDRPLSLDVRRFRGDRVPSEWPTRLDRGEGPGSWPWVGFWENRPSFIEPTPFTDESPF